MKKKKANSDSEILDKFKLWVAVQLLPINDNRHIFYSLISVLIYILTPKVRMNYSNFFGGVH